MYWLTPSRSGQVTHGLFPPICETGNSLLGLVTLVCTTVKLHVPTSLQERNLSPGCSSILLLTCAITLLYAMALLYTLFLLYINITIITGLLLLYISITFVYNCLTFNFNLPLFDCKWSIKGHTYLLTYTNIFYYFYIYI